ncbi:MAG TPA: hypothetical protein VJT11_08360 [Nitrospiraceae bacterium]|nr:hypothetical protein [Nitrospiraceae bacterium]
MTFVLFILCLLLIPMTTVAQTDHSHSPSSAEDCAKLSPELQAIVVAMNGPGSKINALPKPESSPTVETGIHKLEVALLPLSEVALVGKERKPSQNAENLFGGFVRLTVPKDAVYRISTDSTLWIEVLDGETLIERVRTVPRIRCGRIHKSLGFPLQRERSYWVEMSESKRTDVGLLITEEPEH